MNQPHNLEAPAHYGYDNTIQAFLTSLLVGGGAYGGGQLANHLMGMKKKKEDLSQSIPIQIPHGADKQASVHPGPSPVDPSVLSGHPGMLQALAILAGGGAGFMGAKGMYDAYQGNSLKRELAHEKEKYTNALNATKVAIDTDTPLVDSFCDGLADVVKEANFFGNSSAQNAELHGGPLGSATSLAHSAAKGVTGGDNGILGTAELAALGLGAGSAGLMYHIMSQMQKKKEEQRQQPNIYIQQ